MGKQPERLLNKGPQYLRTRSNSGLFAQHKKSATELLAESKAQFYSNRTVVDLNHQQDLVVSAGQSQRYCSNIKKTEPPRSKSQYDLSQVHLARLDDNSDENNNDTSDDSKDDCLDGSDLLTTHETSIGIDLHGTEQVEEASVSQSFLPKEGAPSFISASVCHLDRAVKPCPKPQPKLTILRSESSAEQIDQQRQEALQNEYTSAKDDLTPVIHKKPMPVPRKSIVKPVPLPRKLSLRSPISENKNNLTTCLTKALSSSFSLQNVSSPNINFAIETQQSSPNINFEIETQQFKAQTPTTGNSVQRKHSLVESQTHYFTTATSESTFLQPEDSLKSPKEAKSFELKPQAENAQTFTAKPIVKAKPDFQAQKLVVRKVSVIEYGPSIQLAGAQPPVAVSCVSSNGVDKSKGWNLQRKTSSSSTGAQIRTDSNITELNSSTAIVDSRFATIEKGNILSPSRLEMSIESVDQAVYESEISAIPSVSMEAGNTQDDDRETREITRSNSSLSGKFEQQSPSPLSLSPTPHCSSVPRSYSDISCHLEGQHSRDSSIVSNHSRLSRASVGTDLENFFNQMGLEKGVLEPINRLKELQSNEIFDSMSSLDSHDAASICSTYSRSDQEWCDSQSVDRNLQQTSIVERNARIIKWLCNVRKAKSPSQKPDSAAASNA
ncbi:hypothetical protein BsWGS_20097 [Bradybaena similaris]